MESIMLILKCCRCLLVVHQMTMGKPTMQKQETPYNIDGVSNVDVEEAKMLFIEYALDRV